MKYKKGDLVKFPQGRGVWFEDDYGEELPPGAVAVVHSTSESHMSLVFFFNGAKANGFWQGAQDIKLVTESVDG